MQKQRYPTSDLALSELWQGYKQSPHPEKLSAFQSTSVIGLGVSVAGRGSLVFTFWGFISLCFRNRNCSQALLYLHYKTPSCTSLLCCGLLSVRQPFSFLRRSSAAILSVPNPPVSYCSPAPAHEKLKICFIPGRQRRQTETEMKPSFWLLFHFFLFESPTNLQRGPSVPVREMQILHYFKHTITRLSDGSDGFLLSNRY